MIAIFLAIAIIVSTIAVVGLRVDFKKFAMNDFEYYLYLEKKNLEELMGEDLVNLFESCDSIFAKSTLTGSLSGNALNYARNEGLKQFATVLSDSELKIKTDYNGSDILNIDTDWLYGDKTQVLDLIVSFLNGDLILSSDSITDRYYSLLKSFNSEYSLTEIKEAFHKLLLAIYEHFNGFEEYVIVGSTKYEGVEVTRIKIDLNCVFVAELTEFIMEYLAKDDILLSAYYCYQLLCMDADITAVYEKNLYSEFKEYFSEQQDWDFWWIEDKLEIEYQAVYSKNGQILNREMIYREVEDEIEYIFKNDITRNKSGEVSSSVRVEGEELLKVSNYSGELSITVKPDEDFTWTLSCVYNSDSINLSFFGKDNQYWCGYDSALEKHTYDKLSLNLELNTTLGSYNFSPDKNLTENTRALNEAELQKVVSNIESRLESVFG